MLLYQYFYKLFLTGIHKSLMEKQLSQSEGTVDKI